MNSRDYFPLGLAEATAFCNRTEETKLLLANIKHNKHTLLMATRRYGKSSLALKALVLSKLPYVETDFYMARSEKIVESYILVSISELIGKALGSIDKLTASIRRYVKSLKPSFEIGTNALKLQLSPDNEIDPATNVKEGLLLLEKLLSEKKQHAVLLFDEFQTVGVIAQGTGIEAAIRHVAQKTKYLTFIFSGSNRKLLSTMFEDEARPLYKLCWKLSLERINAEYYIKHLQKAAKAAWKDQLPEPVITEILHLTERHPFYVNKLCDRLWTFHDKKPPAIKDVHEHWQKILLEEKSDVVKEITNLSAGQKGVLSYLAKKPDGQLTSKQATLELKMASSSILTAVTGLEEKDIIEKMATHYQIISPVLKHYAVIAG